MEKVFIIGNPRSGTSLFRLMLNAHPQIISPPECGFLHWWFAKYKDWNGLSNTSNQIDIFINDLKSSKKIPNWHLDFEILKQRIIDLKPQDYATLGEIVYLLFAEQKGKNPILIADKNNYYINHLNDLNEIWPTAKYILVVRDGRDVACSYINMEKLVTDSPYKPKLSTDISTIAKEWVDNNKKCIDFINSLNNTRSFIVRYEDIVTNPILFLTKVCNFLGIDFDKEMLTYYIKNIELQDEPISTLDWKLKTLESPDKNNIGKHKKELSGENYNEFNAIATSLLQKFNYEI
jgi:hypothetical protein